MVIFISVTFGAVIVRLADVELAPENRLDSLLLRCIEEVHCPKDVAVIRHRDGLLAYLVDMRHQFVDVASPI
jgi:hypothetical protein